MPGSKRTTGIGGSRIVQSAAAKKDVSRGIAIDTGSRPASCLHQVKKERKV
ncbi:hypothetical protein SLEP1_g41923 [Rubroshorea leprosula]|uniref:Uncharacterized protein n=1 Tax=Rubroshorea leprosula TaxID=152421 RepID=A0AAV5L8G6_9ROSI|nr:hypothetical protein SLEP1_g41923 [Rubroshorea leprosula]